MAATAPATGTKVEALRVSAFTVPLEGEECDGTFCWNSVTMIAVEAEADGAVGLGYTYGDVSVGRLIRSKLVDVVEGRDAMAVERLYEDMRGQLRNAGAKAGGAMALSAVDTALWDLKARLLDVSLVDLWSPMYPEGAAVYGSGGFVNLSDEELAGQLRGWAEQGMGAVKMKVGREPGRDFARLKTARDAVGPDVELMIDANGGWSRKQAVFWCHEAARYGVTYVEEPVSSDDRVGLRQVREQAPPGVAIAAGEYGWDVYHVRDLLVGECVDIVQIDVTRVGGYTPFRRAAALCEAHHAPISAHCAPALSAHVCCSVRRFLHMEYFHDHVHAEAALLDGTLSPHGGRLVPDRSRPGHGLSLRREAAERFKEEI